MCVKLSSSFDDVDDDNNSAKKRVNMGVTLVHHSTMQSLGIRHQLGTVEDH